MAGRKKTVCTRENVNRVVQLVEEDPTINIRKVMKKLNLTYYCVQKILKDEGYHAYHYTPTQDLNPQDPEKRLAFCRWAFAKYEEDQFFFLNVMFTNECDITNEVLHNQQNYHYYARENPHVTRSNHFQVCIV